MADELVRTIVATLVGRVRSAGSALARRKPPRIRGLRMRLRGQAAQAQIGDTAQEAAARRFFEQALALDPDYPRAHAGLAVVLLCEWFRFADPAEALLEAALEHAETIGRDRSRGLPAPGGAGLGPAALQALRSERAALPARHRAQSQQPGGAGGDGLGLQLPGAAGRRDPVVRAGAAHRSLFRRKLVLELLGAAYFNARRYDDAIKALEHIPNAANWVKAYAAASCALAGRTDCARRIARSLASEAPHFYAEAILRKEPYRNPADLEHLAEGFPKAGLLTETQPCEIAAEAARYYLTGRSPFIHGARGKPTFRATS